MTSPTQRPDGAAFTEGPWSFKTDRVSGDNGIVAPGTGVFAEAFADIRRSGENARAEALANARLIAAAPDLYAALNDLLIAIDTAVNTKTMNAVKEQARAALSLARKEPSHVE